ncbi:MAG: glycosyltransferase [Desulfomonile tiedjei]|uniref:Glycosyltransferase n=1 Tax=Desulfomonile tiedjei TaxID=2358 RepID=A0A9D6V4P1_9BACT|nr:glycosyltransferase [Desulfomonile tiedjei]
MNDLLFVLAGAVLLFEMGFWVLRARELVETASDRVPLVDPKRIALLPKNAPLISVVVPAHNEEAVIRDCLQSVLEQDYPRLELILVDDRSTDNTLAVAEQLAGEKAPFKIVKVTDLPQGWTGKCHALHAGVRHASGEWLAFLDADSTLHKSAIAQCYHEAVNAHVNMITLSPQFVMKTFWEKALQPTFAAMSCILFPLARVNDPSSPVASANGMFYLINRQAYDKIDGHRDVRNLAVEDIGIGMRVKASGLGLLFANGRKLLRTRMYTNFSQVVDGWTRILSASMNYRMSTVLKYLGVHVLMSFPAFVLALCFFAPAARELWPNTWFILPAVVTLGASAVSAFYCTQMGAPKKLSGLFGLGNLMLIWVFIVIVKKILMKDALQWRGTTYQTSTYQPTRLNPVSSGLYHSSAGSALEEMN